MFSKHKSPKDFYLFNIQLKLDLIQKELRHQRSDNTTILRHLETIIHELDIEKQADSYYQEKLEDSVTTSPQTDPGTIDGPDRRDLD